MAQSIRVSDDFYELAQQVAARMNRSLAQQVEHWARLGLRVELGITAAQALALLSDDQEAERLVARTLDAPVASDGSSALVALRKARLEADVIAGRRRADALLTIPTSIVEAAKLEFPRDAFGRAKSW